MPPLRWFCRSHLKRIRDRIKDRLVLIKVTFYSFFCNAFIDKYYVADTAMEPMFWFVDHFTKFFGPLFVGAVILLTISVVIFVYVIGVPYWWNRSPAILAVLVVIGHWLLVNVVFHFYMAALTPPGFPPEGTLIPEAVSICKKCISPKPPRTHHCSICNRCILKMDHHCPWVNNCIGYYNHRYFFMFMIYVLVGLLFILTFGYDLFWDEIILNTGNRTVQSQENLNFSASVEEHLLNSNSFMTVDPLTLSDLENAPLIEWMKDQYWFHGVMMYLTLLCSGVFIALLALMLYHLNMITRGETSVESHINKAETKRLKKLGKVYHNPYNFGPAENWRIFFGLERGRSWRHLIFPSTHKPEGSGLRWRSATYNIWNCTKQEMDYHCPSNG